MAYYETDNYDDFRRHVDKWFGGNFTISFGDRRKPKAQFEAFATNHLSSIFFTSVSGMPESFPQEFTGPSAIHVADMDGCKFSP